MSLINLLYIFENMENCIEGLQRMQEDLVISAQKTKETPGKSKGSVRKEM